MTIDVRTIEFAPDGATVTMAKETFLCTEPDIESSSVVCRLSKGETVKLVGQLVGERSAWFMVEPFPNVRGWIAPMSLMNWQLLKRALPKPIHVAGVVA